MTVNLEKIYFAYILKNKRHFEAVKPNFFRNPDIEFVYKIIRDYMMKNTDSDVPSNKQIVEMVRIEDKEKSITKEMLVSILKMNLDEYDEEKFIKPRFKGWVITNRVKSGTNEIIDKSRNLETETELLDIIGVADTIRNIAEDATNSDFDMDDEDLGSDFDDAEEHVQDHSAIKVKTGYDCIDHILGGGWDISTLNMIMGETNSGKCSFDNFIYIKNKKTSKIEKVKIEDFFDKIKNG